jgi:hypothetical protein
MHNVLARARARGSAPPLEQELIDHLAARIREPWPEPTIVKPHFSSTRSEPTLSRATRP